MILILGGTADARRFGRLVNDADMRGVISMVGATKAPAGQALPVRVGPFGGLSNLRAYLRDELVRCVVDMTHPFARQMTARGAEACAAEDIPFLRFERPQWHPGAQDRWTMAHSPQDVAGLVPKGARVLVAAGPESAKIYGLEGYNVLCRRAEPTDAQPPEGWSWVVGRPPYLLADELDLLQRESIDLMVCKNAGGDENFAKLAACAQLGIPVVMVQRPPLPEGIKTVETLWAALDWAKSKRRL